MAALITLLIVLILSILITKIATVALVHTGLSREIARFQARSAFSGVGFTTTESEKVVNHPVRRRVLLVLMLLGNAGIVTAIASIILTFTNVHGTSMAVTRLLAILVGLILLWIISTNRWVDGHLSKIIGWALTRYTDLDVRDYANLLHIAGDYKINELFIEPDDWLAGRHLQEMRLQDEGVQVLGITRSDGTYLGAPDGTMRVDAGDTLLLYGRGTALVMLDRRRKGAEGDLEHNRAVDEQRRLVDREKRQDVTQAE